MPFPAAAETETKQVRVASFRGIINNLPPDRIPLDAFADARNIIPGLGDKRAGNATYLTTAAANAIQGLHGYYKQATSNRYLLWGSGGTLYRDQSTSVKTGLHATNRMEFATWTDVAYFVNGNDGLGYVNGTTYGKIHPTPVGAVVPYVPTPDDNELNDASSPIQTSKYITVYKNHVCLAGSTALPYRVYFSDLTQSATDGAPTYFKSTSALDFQSPGGGAITGLLGTNSALIVFKDDSIFSVTGSVLASFVVNVITTQVGCPSGRTAQFIPGLGVVFQAGDGHFYRLVNFEGTDAQFGLRRLSKHFAGDYGTGIADLNFAKLNQNAAGAYGDYYWCAVCTDANTVPNLVYVMNHRKLSGSPDGDPTAEFVPWSIYSHPTASVFGIFNNGTSEFFLAGDNATGQIWKLDAASYVDNATAIDGYFDTAKLHFGIPERRKTHQYMHVTFEGLTDATAVLAVTVFVDGRPSITLTSLAMTGNTILWDAATWDVDPWDITRANRTKRLAVNKTGQLFQFRFRNNQSGIAMRIFEHRHVFTPGLDV